MRPLASSSALYSDMTAGRSVVECTLRVTDTRGVSHWKPTLKPLRRPVMTYSTYALSGCAARVASQMSGLSGVETCSSSGTMYLYGGQQKLRCIRSAV